MSALPPPPPPPPSPPHQTYPVTAHVHPGYATTFVPQQPGPAPGVAYAGFWIRLLARIVDMLLIFVIPLIVFSVIALAVDSQCTTTVGPATVTRICTVSRTSASVYLATFWLVPAAYYPLMWATGATVGQRALGLRVVDEHTGQRLVVAQLVGRFFGGVLSVACLWIGVIWIAFDPRKQGWHDKIAGTLVIRRLY